jgi:hypothetical protein
MQYAVEMGSLATIFIPSFIHIGSTIPTFMGVGIHRFTDSMEIA